MFLNCIGLHGLLQGWLYLFNRFLHIFSLTGWSFTMWIFCTQHIAVISLASTVRFRILPVKFSSTLFHSKCGINKGLIKGEAQ
jgi:hypothetical protein